MKWNGGASGVTPSANRNSYRVAIFFYILTQGSVLRPQPWAGESQLLQSCCCLCKPLPEASPRGGSYFLLCLRLLGAAPSPWGRLGWGFYVGWYAPPTTLTELRLHSPELRLPSPLGESWRGASAFYLLSHYTKRGATRRFPPTLCGLLARPPRCSLY